MNLKINGEFQEFHDGVTLSEVIDSLGLTGKFIAVERNLEVVSYKKYQETALEDGDQLEIVSLVGGG